MRFWGSRGEGFVGVRTVEYGAEEGIIVFLSGSGGGYGRRNRRGDSRVYGWSRCDALVKISGSDAAGFAKTVIADVVLVCGGSGERWY